MTQSDHDADDATAPQLPRHRVRRGITTARLAIRLVSAAARWEFRFTLALTVMGSVLTAAELLVVRHLVELLIQSDTTPRDLAPGLTLLGALVVGTALVGAAIGELRILINELVHRTAMDQLLEVSTTADLEAFDDPNFHDRVQRARQNVSDNTWQVVWGLVTTMTTLLSAAAVTLVLFVIAPLLVPVMLIAYVPIAFVNVRNTRALYQVQFALTETDRDRDYHERLLTGRLEAKEVRAFDLATLLRRRHDELSAQRVAFTRQVVKKRAGAALIGSSITAVVLVATLAAVMILALDGHITVGDAAVAVVGLRQLASQLRGVNEATNSMVEGVTFLRDFESFRASMPVAPVPTATPPPTPSRITVKNVSYHYAAGVGDALSDVSLELHPGQVVAIVGPNGSGKSTLAKLLCGLLPPASGTIMWDDVDTADCDMAEIRKLVSPVFQDFTRYEHPARDAIGFGDVTRLHDDAAIVEAGEQAGVDEFIVDLPHGYDTRLSPAYCGGAELSVGQWQRIAIARAFFRNAPLVVMDEPAASLDPRAERDLFERLHELGRNRMVVFISHRFATVRRANQIVVLLEGRVVEQGTHDDLMALGAVYAELYTLQAQPFA